jgi:hypothetical protein
MEKNDERHIQFSDGTEIAIRGVRTIIDGITAMGRHVFSDLFNWVVEWASKIDGRAFIDGRWTRHIVLVFADEALERDDITESEKADLSRYVEEFKSCIDQIISCEDKCDKRAALIAIERALMIGAESRVPSEKLKEIQQEFKRKERDAKRNHGAEQAATARRAKEKQDVECAEALKEAITAYAKEHSLILAVSAKCAESIRLGVCDRLSVCQKQSVRDKLKSGWPSSSTIKDAISELKKDKTKRTVLT